MGLSARGGGHFQVCSGVVFVLRQLARGFVFLVLAAASAGAADFVEFRFREPQPVAYRVELPAGARVTAMLQPELAARRSDDAAQTVDLTSRISLRLADGVDVNKLVAGTKLVVDRVFAPQWFILQAPDAWTAAREAERLAALPDVLAAHPVRRFPMRTAGPYAARFNDRLIPNQWNLENRDITGAQPGVDLNVRAAWPFSQGKGVVVAIADEGVELAHPDFVNPAAGQPHYNFENQTTNGNPLLASDNHGTAVAGYAVAQGNNGIGISGVAPAASLASWKMLASTEEQIGQMFQYQSNVVSVQNHSWLNSGFGLIGNSAMAETGLSNALTFGRGGRGILMTRAAGNDRDIAANANDQSYTADPRVITVAGVRITGRVASYSTPGASVLVAAPVGDDVIGSIIPPTVNAPPTTDRTGTSFGYNRVQPLNNDDSADYAFDSSSPHGTSFAAPQIAGLCALLLGANTNLAIRDVQQILALSARHYDLADRDLATNGAGLRVSHNLGFGVPDAGLAVRLAQVWSNRTSATTTTLVSNVTQVIPDAGFLVRATGANVPVELGSIGGLMPDEGLHPEKAPGENLRPDSPTASLPLVFVGQANSALTTNLTGKGALIQRGVSTFSEKIKRAQDAGAAFAVIYDNIASTNLFSMQLTGTLLAIPSIFIGLTNGEALAAVAQTNANLRAQLELDAARYPFTVTNELNCEHVGVRVQTTHNFCGDLRITVTSPAGTRSILQRFTIPTSSLNTNISGSPLTDWTYYSTHHFFEGSVGTWTVQVSDEVKGGRSDTGSVTSLSLIVKGVPILDLDHDGLDDNWETARLGSLASGPLDDPDGDGFNNAREQAIGSHPNDPNSPFPFALDASVWNPSLRLLRVSWPAAAGRAYELRVNTNSAGAFTTLTNVTGRFPDGEVFLPYGGGPQFFQLRAP
ncbi:MAG: Peptidase S8 and S53 subtilisin kexin sedolisin [Limisphaerales bacterium]|nr:MAG: Peptidase S8 and S53 subtilisin kexin sedolisin [Limisphaerales bacterium]KAG0509888.1 MAG: Peptidase S8 and S53 subtilisin kexin sedolisin [Limisphaerales bacterium]TXT50641.1 MAG: Peptidase S8 and S53 subtilisin kexin sedolisin [Limisphaerales bacterium]